MNETDVRLTRYLEIESLLNTFFSLFDYCWRYCVSVEKEQNCNRPVCACCTKKYYSINDLSHPAFIRLREEREKRFGRPEDQVWENPVSPCEYHNPEKGCVLSTHKSPTCISFFCREGIDFLRQRRIFGYDYLGIYNALEWILTGDLSGKQYIQFRDSVMDMIEEGKRIEF